MTKFGTYPKEVKIAAKRIWFKYYKTLTMDQMISLDDLLQVGHMSYLKEKTVLAIERDIIDYLRSVIRGFWGAKVLPRTEIKPIHKKASYDFNHHEMVYIEQIFSRLTDKEKGIVKQLLEGYDYIDVAEFYGISEYGLWYHLRKIKKKIKYMNRLALAPSVWVAAEKKSVTGLGTAGHAPNQCAKSVERLLSQRHPHRSTVR